VLGLGGPVELERPLEALDRLARPAAAVRHLAEALVRLRPREVGARVLEHRREEALRQVELLQAERDLGLEEGPARLEAAVLRPGGEPVLGDPEPPAELAEELERRDAVTRLDAGDVGGRAAGKGQLPLAQPGLLARRAKAQADRAGVIDVCRLLSWHLNTCVDSGLALGPGAVQSGERRKDGSHDDSSGSALRCVGVVRRTRRRHALVVG
jgi:hypothetical protein